MDMTNGNARVLRPSEYNIWEVDVESTEETIDNQSLKEDDAPLKPYFISLGLPIAQAILLVYFTQFIASTTDIYILFFAFIGATILAFASDVTGAIVAYRTIREQNHWACLITLLINVSFCITKIWLIGRSIMEVM